MGVLKRVFAVLMMGLLLWASGCALMHEMKPHRLKRWNRMPAPTKDPEFSLHMKPANKLSRFVS
jgi:hypothetical protein